MTSAVMDELRLLGKRQIKRRGLRKFSQLLGPAVCGVVGDKEFFDSRAVADSVQKRALMRVAVEDEWMSTCCCSDGNGPGRP